MPYVSTFPAHAVTVMQNATAHNATNAVNPRFLIFPPPLFFVYFKPAPRASGRVETPVIAVPIPSTRFRSAEKKTAAPGICAFSDWIDTEKHGFP
jgi:hypothetical protein